MAGMVVYVCTFISAVLNGINYNLSMLLFITTYNKTNNENICLKTLLE